MAIQEPFLKWSDLRLRYPIMCCSIMDCRFRIRDRLFAPVGSACTPAYDTNPFATSVSVCKSVRVMVGVDIRVLFVGGSD